jgi:hypothetical protein
MPLTLDALAKLGSWSVFEDALVALHKINQAARPQGLSRFGVVAGRDAAADKAAVSKAHADLHKALTPLLRDAKSAGLTSADDLRTFKDEVNAAAAEIADALDPKTRAFLGAPYGKGRPPVAMNVKAARDASVPVERRRPMAGRVEGAESVTVKDVTKPGPEFGKEFSPVPSGEGVVVSGGRKLEPETPFLEAEDDLDIDELIRRLQGRGAVVGAERFRGANLPAAAPATRGAARAGVGGDMRVMDPELGDIAISPGQPSQMMIPGVGAARRTYNLGELPLMKQTTAPPAEIGGEVPGQMTLDELLAELTAAR